MATINRFFELPEIEDGFSWCCENGCGECEIVQKRHTRMIETDKETGEILNAEYHYYPASKCCGAGVFLWDNNLDVEVVFSEVEVKK